MNLLLEGAKALLAPAINTLFPDPPLLQCHVDVPARVTLYSWGARFKLGDRGICPGPGYLELRASGAYSRRSGMGTLWCWDWMSAPSLELAEALAALLPVRTRINNSFWYDPHVRGPTTRRVWALGVGFFWQPTEEMLRDQVQDRLLHRRVG